MQKDTNINSQAKTTFTAQQITWRLASSFTLGIILCFSFAPFYAWFLAIFIPAIIFKLWQKLSLKMAVLNGFVFGLGFYAAGTSWIYQSIAHFSQASVLASIALTSLFVIYFSCFFALLAFILKRFFDLRSNWQILLIFPALWVLMEWMIGHLLTGFPWLLIGYTQISSPLHVFAPYVGVYGLSYITIFMSAILVVLTQQGQTKSYWGTWALLAIIVGLSTWAKHVDWTKPTNKLQTVSIVQAQIQPTLKWLPTTLPHIENTYSELSAPYWQKSNLIIWPESALPIQPQQIQPWLSMIAAKLKINHNHLITGIITSNKQEQYFNSAMLLSPNQAPQFVNKRHLVPFGEYFPLRSIFGFIYDAFQVPMSDLSAGASKQNLLHYGSWKIAPYICYEIAYPDEVMSTLSNANLLLVISDDSWFGHSFASYQHLGIAQMRALETGRYLIFSNDTGPSAIIKQNGSIAKQTTRDEQSVLIGTVEQMTGKTPFMKWHNWPILLLALAALATSILIIIIRRNTQNMDI